MKTYLFSSESVTEGHPDKMADQISDAILDYIIEKDTNAKVACETMLSNGFCIIAGEIQTSTYAPMQEIAREVIRNIGYTDAHFGFDYRSAGILNAVGEQSLDISQCIYKEDGQIAAGDQGVVFGYACKETQTLMPLPIHLAHTLSASLAKARKNGLLPFLRPDGKVQVSVRYENDAPIGIDNIVISAQHSPDVPYRVLQESIIEEIIKQNIPASLLTQTNYHVNPSGKFVLGGPQADTGQSGRKTVVDTYGGSAPNGGGSLSGKDPTKIDRSGSYMARYIAKNLVESGICTKALIQISYAIGLVQPVSVMVNCFGTARVGESQILQAIFKHFDLSINGMIETLDLFKPIYTQLASYGHFGREDLDLRWEKCDKAEALRNYFSK